MTISLGYSQPGAGATTPIARNTWDVFSVFSDAYTPVAGTRNYNPGWGQAGSASVVSIAGDNVWRATNLNYQGLDFGSNINVAAMSTFHVDVWTSDETSLQFFQINNGGGERSVSLTPLNQNSWNSYDIPLTSWTSQSGFSAANLFQFKIVGSGGKTVYLDNMYFWRAATVQPPTIGAFTVPAKLTTDAPFILTAPTSNSSGAWSYAISPAGIATISGNTVTIAGAGTATITATQAADGSFGSISTSASLVVSIPPPASAAPPPPVRNAWDVVSLYSGAYTPTTGATWQNGADVSISGDNARFFNGFTLARLAFGARSIVGMTTLHIDVYTVNQNQLWFEINGNRKVVSSIPLNGWASFDIPLTDYVGLNLANVSFFDLNNPTGAAAPVKVVYLDNIYFYRAATDNPPTIGALTVPSPKTFGDAPFVLTNPTSNSSGAWSYSSSPAGVVTFSGNTATIVGGGTTTITATQAAVPGTFGAASTTASLVVNFPAPGTSPIPPVRNSIDVVSMYTGTPTTYANGTTAVQASWSTGSTSSNFSFANGTDTCIQVNNLGFFGLVTNGANFSVAGMTKLHVDIYCNTPITNMILNLLAPSDRNYTTGPLVAGWNSLDITLATAYPGVLTNINGIKFEQNVGSARQIYIDNVYFYYAPTTPTISNFSSVAKVMGAAPFTLSATSDSPATITYTSSNESVATIIGNTVTVVGIGTSTLTASQVATGSFAAGSATATLTVTGSTTPLGGPTAPPVRNSWDAFSVFSDEASYTVVPGTRNYNPGWGQAGAGAVVLAGADNVWRASNLNYQGIVFGSNVDVSAMTHFHVDVWTFDETSLQFFQISNTTGERSVNLGSPYPALTQGSWVSYDIPLTAWTSQSGFTTSALKEFKIVGSGGKTVYLDNMYFYRAATTQPPTLGAFTVPAQVGGAAPFTLTPPTSNSAGAFTYSSSNESVATIIGDIITIVGAGTSTITATQAADGSYGTASTTATLTVTPAAAPTPPARNTWDVVSLYSGAYTSTTGATWQNGTDVSLSGDNARFFNGFTLARLAFGARSIASMTTLHIDVYTLNQNQLWFEINGNRKVVSSIPLNGWASFDIPLTDYVGLNLANVSFFDLNNPTGAVAPVKVVYLDNIYFYRAATDAPPTIGALTVPTPKVLGDAPFTLTDPTSDSSGTWTYSSSPAGVVTFSGNTVTIVGGGTTTITATQAAVPGSFGPASTSAPLVVTYPLPGASPIPPARNPASVISMYTGTPATYTNAPNYIIGRSSWTGASTLTEVSNGTNTALRIDNLGFMGLVDTVSERRLNVTGMDNLHLDVYLNAPINTNPALSRLFIFLLAPGDNNKSVANLVQGWNSIDIPLSDYPGATLSNIYGLKIEQNSSQTGNIQIYLDNIYFNKACYTPLATIVSNGGDFCSGSNATFTVNGTEGSTLDYTITGQVGTQQLALTGANQTITAVNPSGDVTLDLITVTNATCLTATSSSTFETGSSTVAITTEIDFNNIDDDCDGSKFNGHAPVVVDLTTPSGALFPITTPIDCSVATNTGDYSGVDVSYKFKVTKTNAPTSVAYVTSNSPSFDLSLASNAAYSSTFSVTATAIVNGEEQPYNGNTVIYTVPLAYFSNVNTYCGQTMPAINAVVRCTVPSGVVGTLAYRFKVKNNITDTTVTYDSAVPNFKLTATSVYAYATSYDVQVAPLVNGVEHPYSAVCVITTPAIPLNQVGPCTQTLTSLSDRIYANYTIFGSQLYRFRVAESTAPTTYYYATSVGPNFRLTSVPGLPVNFGKTYLVSVQTDLTNNEIAVTSSYDVPCTVNTPAVTAVNVVANQCGEHLVTITDRIFVNSVPNAVSYNYRVKKGLAGTEYDFNSSYTNFRLSNVVGLSLTYASDYYVSVQSIIRIDGIDYPSNFSTPCIITTPDFPTVSLQASQCSDGNLENPGPYMVPTTGTPIYCDFVSGATYEFSLQEYDGENPVGDPLTSLVRPTNNFTLHQVAGVLPNKIYLVSVTLTSYGQGPIGHACVIQSPAAAREIAPVAGGNMKVEFSAVAYPNPFANNFVIDVKTRNESAVSLKVYDMIGRLVDQKSVNVSDLQASPIGDNYPSGVYNVIVTQGEDVRTLRVVKR